MRVAFLTLGCKVNSYETEKMKINFEKKGHSVVAFDEEADAYIIKLTENPEKCFIGQNA